MKVQWNNQLVCCHHQAIQRGVWDCPICLNSLPTAAGIWSPHRRTVLLSCSHLFHHHCLEVLEGFASDSRPSCPVCRSTYRKKLMRPGSGARQHVTCCSGGQSAQPWHASLNFKGSIKFAVLIVLPTPCCIYGETWGLFLLF